MDAFKIAEESIKNGEALLAELKTCIEKCVEQDAEIVRLKGDAEKAVAEANYWRESKINNPCGHSGMESRSCEKCGYPDPVGTIEFLNHNLAAARKVIDGAYSYAKEMQEQDINYGNVDIGDTLHELIMLLCKD